MVVHTAWPILTWLRVKIGDGFRNQLHRQSCLRLMKLDGALNFGIKEQASFSNWRTQPNFFVQTLRHVFNVQKQTTNKHAVLH